ncbi:hypothetical protein VNO80_27198 [Phaseolus coccineus]|uniref:Uncharacterized protein n=1 Tax=Phaseolus coccineus TaxID=3886 RepID=A0AAN9QL48_PHACN
MFYKSDSRNSLSKLFTFSTVEIVTCFCTFAFLKIVGLVFTQASTMAFGCKAPINITSSYVLDEYPSLGISIEHQKRMIDF